MEWRSRTLAANYVLATTDKTIPWGTDQGGTSGLTVDGTGKMTAVKAGVYQVRADLTLAQSGGTGGLYTIVRVDQRRAGGVIASRTVVGYSAGPSLFGAVGVTAILNALAGDTFEVAASSQAANVAVDSRSHFNVNQIV
jgi:hypothetical protein